MIRLSDSTRINKGQGMKRLSILSVSCAVLALSACDHYSNKLAAMEPLSTNPAQISPAAGGEMTFRHYLANEYYHMAKYEQEEMYDYQAAKYFTEKADNLASGSMVSPASLNEFTIERDHQQELSVARAQLIDALKTYNVPENRYALAMAQSRYDCWIDQQSESYEGNEVLTCKNEFNHAMASLVPPDGQEIRIAVPFDPGSQQLSEEARISISRALSFWRVNEGRGYQIILNPSQVSAEETDRQISMVRSILQYNGVSPAAIKVEQASEESPSFEILFEKNEEEIKQQV